MSMDNCNFGPLIHAAHDQEAKRASQTVRDYCKSQETCSPTCIFFDKIKVKCKFHLKNKYGGIIAPEEWEV